MPNEITIPEDGLSSENQIGISPVPNDDSIYVSQNSASAGTGTTTVAKGRAPYVSPAARARIAAAQQARWAAVRQEKSPAAEKK